MIKVTIAHREIRGLKHLTAVVDSIDFMNDSYLKYTTAINNNVNPLEYYLLSKQRIKGLHNDTQNGIDLE